MRQKNKIHALKVGKNLFRVQGGCYGKDIRFVFGTTLDHVQKRFKSRKLGSKWKVTRIPNWRCFFVRMTR